MGPVDSPDKEPVMTSSCISYKGENTGARRITFGMAFITTYTSGLLILYFAKTGTTSRVNVIGELLCTSNYIKSHVANRRLYL